MRISIFQPLKLRFEQENWALSPEFAVLDVILESHPQLIEIVAEDILCDSTPSNFGRKDMPSVDQIVRAAIFKEMKGLDYRELEFAQEDSRICEMFLKLDISRPFAFQTWQKYISKISPKNVQKLLFELNKIAIGEGLEDVEKLRQDTTVVESDIHYPTNNSLVWDCLKEAERLLSHLKEESDKFDYRTYTKEGKKTFFKINNTKCGDKRKDLFIKQLNIFTKSINQVANVVKKKLTCSPKGQLILLQLEKMLPVFHQVFEMTKRREINGESVPNCDKIFSIYEQHTDIVVKGSREVLFGHKVSLSTGKSNLILTCDVVKGNPADTTLFVPTLEKVQEIYGITPRDVVTDGGYASLKNMEYAKGQGIINVVFNKIVGSLKNQTSSLNMETRLKKWRGGVEAVISNLKRGYNIRRCSWKGEAHFKAKVLWSAIAYNIRVMTALILQKI